MGSFFSNISFKKNNISKDKLIEFVNQSSSLNGISAKYLMNIKEDNEWVTIYDPFEDSDNDIYKLAQTLNKLLGTPIFIAQCCDSDFMLLGIAVKNDIDICSVGIPYEEEEKLIPDIQKWSILFNTNDKKEKFLKIIDVDYVFSEESMEPLAEILGFKEEDINKTYDEALEENDIIRI